MYIPPIPSPFYIILILLLIKTSPTLPVYDIISLLSQMNNCFDMKSNGPYFAFLFSYACVWIVFPSHTIMLLVFENEMIGTANSDLGETIFFQFVFYLFTEPSNDFKKWLTCIPRVNDNRCSIPKCYGVNTGPKLK